jgi:signal transduction histidine kinase
VKRVILQIRENLKLELMASVLICLIFVLGTFFISFFFMRAYHMNRHSMESMEAKMQELASDYQSLVLNENITSADTEITRRWAEEKHASVFRDVDNPRDTIKTHMTIDIGPDGSIFSFTDIVHYKDGDIPVIISYNPASAIRFSSWTVSLLLAFDVFLLAMFLILKKKLDYIQRIERGIDIFESGRLSHTIPVEGTDELARLAAGLNHMSGSIQSRIESEQKVLAINRQIIGDLSHDIRTPLTVGMGYLSLLLENNNLSEQEHKEYLALALKKAEQIEERTKMLLEFSTLLSGQLPVHKTVIDARTMTDQLKDELSAIAELRVSDDIPADTKIIGDISLLERLFDNLLSNLRKHGDLTFPVCFRAFRDGGYVRMEIENATSKEPATEKSASLGLKICSRILELHEGRFETITSNDTFRIYFSIPVCFL